MATKTGGVGYLGALNSGKKPSRLAAWAVIGREILLRSTCDGGDPADLSFTVGLEDRLLGANIPGVALEFDPKRPTPSSSRPRGGVVV